ncbi:hypothetical protein CKO29_00440 [Allochromatium vinosum]|nr:hypothetical protein [Allochromatium vinosum]
MDAMIMETAPTLLRLLIVEDSADDADLLVHTLKEAGYQVEHRCVETVEQLREAWLIGPWDIIISDDRLPGLDDPKALARMRRGWPDVPLIVLLDAADEDIGVRAMKAGANDYILKGHLARLGVLVERELQEANRRRQTLVTKVQFRALLDSVQDAIMVVDEHGRIQVYNQGAEAIFGYAMREMLGQGIGFLLPGDGYERLKCNPVQLKSPGDLTGTQVYERRYVVVEGRRHDGRMLTLEASSSCASVFGSRTYTFILRDITEQQQAEAALRESERRYRELVQSASSAIIRWTRDGTLTFFNEYAERFFGWSAEEVVGKCRIDILVPDQTSTGTDLRGLIENLLAHPEDYRSNINENVCRDGRRVWMSWTNQAIRDAHGAVSEILSVGSDVTARLQAEEAVRRLNADLEQRVTERTAELRAAREQALRLAQARSEFLANMSHEIRTPMNAVLGLAYLLERQENLPEEACDLARKIYHSGQSLLGIINDILDVSKIESGKILIEQTRFQLSQVLDNLATIMTTAARGKDLALAIVPPRDCDWPLLGDPLRLGQILINLTNNAIKFTDSGVVEVRITPVESSASNLVMRFTVRDTGIGIDAETQARLFQPFMQADASTTRRFGGSGLGLMISRQLVELMGGRLGVESAPGVGSTFWFEVPLGRTEPDAPDRPRARPLQVLISDDHPCVRDALWATVSALGWSATSVDSRDAVLDAVLNHSFLQGPDAAVLLDWGPERDGLATAQAICQALPASRRPLLFLLTQAPVDQIRQRPDGDIIEAVLAKPLTPTPLYDAVAKARGRRLGKIETPARVRRQPRRLAGRRLLVVDDSEINREVARRIFSDEGATITLANDGQQALDWLQAHPDAVDLVLMDVQMPIMDGHEATRRIRQIPELSRLPVVALTAGALHSQEVLAQEAGMDDFIPKPFEVEQAVTVIRRLTDDRGQTRASTLKASDTEHPPASAATHAPNALPLPGLAIDRALTMWQEAETYRRYLRRFAQEYADVVSRLAAAEPPLAQQLLHTLKGVAGNLGLTEVASQAGRLESLMADPVAAESDATSMTALQSALETALDSIARYTRETPVVSEAGMAAEPESAAKRGRIAPLLHAALSALNEFDIIGAESAVKRLAHELPDDRLVDLREALGNFDARSGVAAVRVLADRLGIAVEHGA